MMSSSTHKRWLPQREHFVHFHDRRAMKAGHPSRSLRLRGPLPTPTLPIDWAKALTFPMDGNDQYGDCMYAAGCHGDNTFTGNNGQESSFDLPTIIRDYLRLSGGDNGLDEGSLIQGWKAGLAGVKDASILDALDIDCNNAQLVQTAIYLFGGVLFMLDVPDSWINTANTGDVWDAPARPDQNNGHGVWWNGVDEKGRYRLQTWGTYVWITPAGVADCDPSGFVVFSLRWFNSQGYAPNGLHYNQLAPLWAQMGGTALPPSPFPAPGPGPGPVPPVPAANILTVVTPIPAGTYPVGAGFLTLPSPLAAGSYPVGPPPAPPPVPVPPTPPAPPVGGVITKDDLAALKRILAENGM